jgi:hypothetical protein
MVKSTMQMRETDAAEVSRAAPRPKTEAPAEEGRGERSSSSAERANAEEEGMAEAGSE